MHHRARITAMAYVLLGGCTSPGAAWLSADDEAAIRRLEAAYTSGWVENDSAAVFRTLTEDVVLLPGRMSPVVGLEGARAFWFPPNAAATTVTAYRTEIDEIDGRGDVAFVRGS